MHTRTHKTTGLTLIEMTLVIATITLLVGFTIPAVKALVGSFHSEGAVKSMIDAALSSARAMAMSKQRYVGVRFQKLCTSDNQADPLKGVLDAPQYMIFIVHDPSMDPDNGFRAVEGLEPIKLPTTMGVMDLSWLQNAASIDEPFELSDATTFSIVFAPSGKLVVHAVLVRNRDGEYQPKNFLEPGDTTARPTSFDDVFNSPKNIIPDRDLPNKEDVGMFIQDDYSPAKNGYADGMELGLGEEGSVTTFCIYDAAILQTLARATPAEVFAYLDGLRRDKPVYVSPYMGHLLSSN